MHNINDAEKKTKKKLCWIRSGSQYVCNVTLFLTPLEEKICVMSAQPTNNKPFESYKSTEKQYLSFYHSKFMMDYLKLLGLLLFSSTLMD